MSCTSIRRLYKKLKYHNCMMLWIENIMIQNEKNELTVEDLTKDHLNIQA